MMQIEILMRNGSLLSTSLKESLIENDECDICNKIYKNYEKIIVNTDDKSASLIYEYISDTILSILKFGVLFNILLDLNIPILDKHSLIGALISIDYEKEKLDLKKAIANIKIIAIDSILQFRLPSLIRSWESLGQLATNLILRISTREELYELISYFINSNEYSPRITITSTDPIKIAIDGNLYSPIKFTNNSEYNILLSIIRLHPSHIIIKNPLLLSTDLLATFKTLGNKKEPT